MSRKDKYYDWYRAFLQMMMSKGVMTGQEVFRGVKSICQAYKESRDFPSSLNINDSGEIAEMIELFLEETNKALKQINLQISKTQDEIKTDGKYTQYYVIHQTYENDQLAKLQKTYSEPEMEWLRLVAEHLVDQEDKLAGETALINLCRNGGNNSSKKKLNVTEADRALATFLADGYLLKVKQGKKSFKYGLGARFLVEMERWLRDTFGEDVWRCGKCGKVGMVGVQCSQPRCGATFHLYCVDTGTKDPKCSKCKTPLKIEGVATKRN